ncbi:50S ribosomal protein L6 [bacterium]|nr:MAG: 50S ribosomal protein L6 [bacterium]
MSRIGDNPIPVPEGVEVKIKGNNISLKGPKGELSRTLVPEVKIKQENGTLVVNRKNDTKQARRMHGLSRSLVENMVIGVSEGFEKTLEVIGVGYKVEQRGKNILLSLGYSHQIFFSPPEGITLEVDVLKRKISAEGTPNQLFIGTIKVAGTDKQLVGQVAAKIRGFRKPDVYKSKGIRYAGERVHIKAGKTAV